MAQTIAVEKSSIYTLKPLLKVKKYPIDFSNGPYFQKAFNKKDCCNEVLGYWDEKNFMILDVIAQELLNKHYRNDAPKDHFDPRVVHWVKCKRHKLDDHAFPVDVELLQMLDGTYEGESDQKSAVKEKANQSVFAKRNYDILLSEKDLYMTYPFLQRYKSKQLCDLITQTSTFRFAPGKYNIKVLKQEPICRPGTTILSKWKYDYGFYTFSPTEQRIQAFQYFNFFDVNVLPVKTSNHGNPRVLERAYEIKFNGLISKFFANNVLFLNNQYMPIKAYDLSAYAQLIYRRFVRTVRSAQVFNVTFTDVYQYLGIRNGDRSHVKIRIKDAFAELADAGLIGGFKADAVKKYRSDWTTFQITRHTGSEK